MIDLTDENKCWKFTEIDILNGKGFELNQHTTISGKLGRFNSALVDPAVYIEPSK
jgi:hypothetical protein